MAILKESEMPEQTTSTRSRRGRTLTCPTLKVVIQLAYIFCSDKGHSCSHEA